MSDFDNEDSNAEEDHRHYDLFRPQEGEPAADEPGSAADETVESSAMADIEPPPPEGDMVPGVEEEPWLEPPVEEQESTGITGAPPETLPDTAGEPSGAADHKSELPLPLLHELEEKPPPKPLELPAADETAAAPGEEEGSGRRLSEQWRIDLKWIFGIPATVVLILTLAALVMFRVTGEPVAVGMIEDTRVRIVGDSRFRSELALADPRILAALDSKDFSTTLYEDPELFQSLIDAIPEAQPEDPLAGHYDYVRSTLGIYDTLGGTIGKSEHIQARSALIALTLLLVLFGVPYIIFSRRLGKIVSTAVSLGLASWFPLLFLMFLRGNLSDWISNRPGIVEDYQTAFVIGMVDSFANGLVNAAMPAYRFFSLVALILLGFGLLGLLVVWWRFNESMLPRKKKLRD